VHAWKILKTVHWMLGKNILPAIILNIASIIEATEFCLEELRWEKTMPFSQLSTTAKPDLSRSVPSISIWNMQPSISIWNMQPSISIWNMQCVNLLYIRNIRKRTITILTFINANAQRNTCSSGSSEVEVKCYVLRDVVYNLLLSKANFFTKKI